MKKRILAYLDRVDTILKENKKDTDWDDVLREHLIQVSFFQHERLVHLLVFILVALLTVICMVTLMFQFNITLLLLLLLFLILLVPYCLHYYLLENSVQKMYTQYDKILEHIRTKQK